MNTAKKDEWDDFIEELANEPIPEATAKSKVETFPCPSCSGTGKYQGRRTVQTKAHCFDCRGLGYFKTDPRKLKQNRAKAAAKREDALKAARDLNAVVGGGELLAKLMDMRSWNDFAASLIQQHTAGKAWSENQIAAAYRMLAKCAATKAAKAAAEPAKDQIDLTPIREMFESAFASGHKRPVYRAEGLVINRAPDSGANPGALYVKNEDKFYGGKVLGTEFSSSRDGRDAGFTPHGNAFAALQLIAGNPLEAAIRYGRRTGKCACCGRKLTATESIERGIGPICAETWGF